MKIRLKLLALPLALLSATAVCAKDKAPPPPAPAEHPDWAKVRATAENGIKTSLFDPSSAQFTYTSGFQWGYTKPILGGKKWGWVACGNMNAKNRLGGYVGAQAFVIRSDEGGNVTWVADGDDFGTCTSGVKAELQPELKDQAALEAQGGARLGVAEELSKLADLKAKGILSEAEFQAQKAKLLAR